MAFEKFGGFVAETGKRIKRTAVNAAKIVTVGAIMSAPMAQAHQPEQTKKENGKKTEQSVMPGPKHIEAMSQKIEDELARDKEAMAKTGHSAAKQDDQTVAQGW